MFCYIALFNVLSGRLFVRHHFEFVITEEVRMQGEWPMVHLRPGEGFKHVRSRGTFSGVLVKARPPRFFSGHPFVHTCVSRWLGIHYVV